MSLSSLPLPLIRKSGCFVNVKSDLHGLNFCKETTNDGDEQEEKCSGQETVNGHETSGYLYFGLMNRNLRFLVPTVVFL